MILDLIVPKYNKRGKNLPKILTSSYQPKGKVKDRLEQIMLLFSRSRTLMDKPYEEFNNKSLINITNECKKLFNSWREPNSTDADDSWKSNAVRPIVRNRAISIAAHLASVIRGNIFAQNENQQSDKEAAIVMKNLVEWADEQSEYDKVYLYSVITALISPAVIVHREFSKVYRTIKDLNDDGSWKEKKILDELLSGFQDTIVPVEELFISNIYESDIQRQNYLIWRRVIDYETARQKYGDNKDFQNVKPGMQVVFDSETAAFYDLHDEELQDHLVEEVIYYDRFSDLQLTVVGGVLLDEPDSPLKRKDKLYPFAKTGYELINEGKFFYYFPLVRKMKDDAQIINDLYNIVIDVAKMQALPPTVVFGDEIINASVLAPGVTTILRGDTKMEKLDPTGNLNAVTATLDRVEASVSESSSDVLQSGQSIKGNQTAFEVSRLEANARTMLGLFGRMVGFFVKEMTALRVGDIIQFMTVGEINEIVGDDATLKYRSFLIPNQTEGGKSTTHRIEFGDFSDTLSSDENQRGMQIMAMEGGMKMEDMMSASSDQVKKAIQKGFNSDQRIFLANPALFRDLKYKVSITADMITPPSENLKKALNLELYDKAIANPLTDQETVTRDLLFGSYQQTRNDTDKYMKKMVAPMQPPIEGQQGSVLNKLFGNGQKKQLNQSADQLQAEAQV